MAGKGPVEAVEDKVEEKKSADELEKEQRMAEIDAANKEKAARVVVLPWDNEEFWENESLRRNVSIRIARPDARFYPDIDLYQAGRKEPDESVRPVDQRGIVPDSAIADVQAATGEIATVPYNAMSEQDWSLKAHELKTEAEKIWFVDRPELREPLFELYVQIGRAAENANNPAPPFYEEIGGIAVNYYWYLAGSMAWETPDLLAKINDQELNLSVSNYRTMLETGQIPLLKLDFTLTESNEEWDPAKFAGEYTLFVNGVKKTITSSKGLLEWPPGRTDIYLKRDDGHSLSDRIELDKFKDKVYFVRGVARKKMGLSFRDQLLEHPNECTPPVDGDVLNYLAIYQKLHGKAEIYIAIPLGGSTAPNKILLWRWDPKGGYLTRVLDNTGGFPVRFAALAGAGLTFSGVTYKSPSQDELNSFASNAATSGGAGGLGGFISAADKFKPTPLALPLSLQIRGHYGRLLVLFGQNYSVRLAQDEGAGDNNWHDKFQAWNPGQDGAPNQHFDVVTPCAAETGSTTPTTPTTPTATTTASTTGGTSAPTSTCGLQLRSRTWQRLNYVGVGGVLGRNAAIGFGLRGYVRAGWYNAPHTVDLTGHVGDAISPLVKNPDGRVNPVLDLDFWGGAAIPFKDSVFVADDKKTGPASLLFGLNVLAGLTF
jgi:hypothetical protein